jgi:hypothetical protein
MTHSLIDRRAFVELSTAAAAGMLVPDLLAQDPLRLLRPSRPETQPVRIRGRVRGGGRGLAGVAVSDGRSVVVTAGDGRYELLSSSEQPFVMVSVPAGHEIPQSETGTARFYQPVTPDRRGDMQASFELTPLPGDDHHHTVLLLADVQTEDAQEMQWFHEQSIPDVQATVRALGDTSTVGIACGDIMFDHLEFYPEYERGVRRMGVPFFQVVGNHDLDYEGRTDEMSTATFSRHFGPRYYSFDRGAVHYVVLDDVFWHGAGYLGYLDANQLAWLEADLALVERGRPVVVAQHIPALGSRHVRDGQRTPNPSVSVTNRQYLYRLLEPYDAHVLVGHTHEQDHVFEHGVHEHVIGTVCGAWWSGPICADGTPNGYGVFEVEGDRIRWRYKTTGHPDDYQMRTYPKGADPTAPDEVVANIWDWDPEWTVVWYENGERRGAMARRTGRDPLSMELHLGPELPPRRTWVDPYPTRHLFYAPVSADTRSVLVEATDRFGRVYTAEVPTA